MPPVPLMTAENTSTAPDAAEFDLDLRVIEAAYPIAKLMCDTSDNCGGTCSGSACGGAANDPF